ncbi:MAG: tyrosine-protein phosphatase [Bacilli bacterium]|nr:tyrosine-protein phosphatase [Bacilli bacterium]
MKAKHYLSLGMLILGLSLVACGKKPAPVVPDNFYNVTKFDTPLDAHSEDMINFMNYDGDYTTLTESTFKSLFHTDPEKSQSEGKTWDIEFDYDGEADSYAVEVALDEDFDNPWVFPAKNGKATIQNLYIGKTHYYRVKAVTGDDVDYSKVYTLETADTAPRLINIDGMTNCRDLGGKVTVNGNIIRQGLIYRTAALDDNMSGSIITDTGRETMLKQLGVRTEIELRGGPKGLGGEQNAKDRPSLLNDESVTSHFNPMGYEGGKSPLFRNIIPVVTFFEHFAEENFYPAFYHCRIGTDRTGFCSTLLNGLLGLSIEDCYRDYLFSNFGKIQKTSTIHQTGSDSPDGYIADLLAWEGETFQQKVYNFLRAIGVRQTTLQGILETLLEGDIPNLEEDRKIITACTSSFEYVSGASCTHSTEFRSPATLTTISAGGEIKAEIESAKGLSSASLYALMTSRNTSSKLSNVLEVSIDDNPISIKDTSFATSALGFSTSEDFWVPALLNDSFAISQGRHTLKIKNKSSNVSVKIEDLSFGIDGDESLDILTAIER